MKKRTLADLRKDALELFNHGLRSVQGYGTVIRSIRKYADRLEFGPEDSPVLEIPLAELERIFIVGAGKATAEMARAAEEVLGTVLTGGVINVKYEHVCDLARVQIVEAGHPLPDDQGLKGAKKILEICHLLKARDLLLVFLSGGGSALLPLPAEGITLRDKQETTDVLLKCGAEIGEMNCIRKHISAVKGGQLVRAAHPATVVTLLLSDVIGDRLDTIASGPTVADETTFADAWGIVEKYDLVSTLPLAVRNRIEKGKDGEIAETPKSGDPCFENVSNIVIASNAIMLRSIESRARSMGYHTLLQTSSLRGEASERGREAAQVAKKILRNSPSDERPACIISGGETTVTIHGSGRGGRNQEFALAAAMELSGTDEIVLLSAGTDGTDGPTDATGGLVDGETAGRVRTRGMEPGTYLANNDSFVVLDEAGALIRTGPTGTNVMDVQITLLFVDGNSFILRHHHACLVHVLNNGNRQILGALT